MSAVHDACPDGGACHHECPISRLDGKGNPCWRVGTCVPLSAYGDTWPQEVLDKHHPGYREVAALAAERDAVRDARNHAAADAKRLGRVLDPMETRLAIARDVLLAAREGRVTCGFDTGLVRPEDASHGAKGSPFGPDCDQPVGHTDEHRKGSGVHGRSWDSYWNRHMEGDSDAARAGGA